MRIHNDDELCEGYLWLRFLLIHGPVSESEEDLKKWKTLLNRQRKYINEYLFATK